MEVVGVIDGTAEERRCCDLIEMGIGKTHYFGRVTLTVDVGLLPVVSLCMDVAWSRTRFGGRDAVLARRNDWRNPIRQIEAVRCLIVPLILFEGRGWGGFRDTDRIYMALVFALWSARISRLGRIPCLSSLRREQLQCQRLTSPMPWTGKKRHNECLASVVKDQRQGDDGLIDPLRPIAR